MSVPNAVATTTTDIKTDKRRSFCFDIEVYPNLFCVNFEHMNSSDSYFFMVYADPEDKSRDINQLKECLDFIKTEVRALIGYNNHHYDDLIVKHLVSTRSIMERCDCMAITRSCKSLNDKIIYEQRSKDMKQRNDPYLESLKRVKAYNSIDLMLMFNTINRVSLKQLAINLKWPVIMDLPHSPEYIVQHTDLPDIEYYNKNDVKITKRVLAEMKDKIKERKDYGTQVNAAVINFNDTNIAKFILKKYYSEATKKPIASFTSDSNRTYYKKIEIGHCISKKISFITKPYQEAFNKFRNTTINPNLSQKEKKSIRQKINGLSINSIQKHMLLTDKNVKQFEYTLQSKYCSHTLGMGGIHSTSTDQILEENEDYLLIDADVSSYYPSIMIQEKLYPYHLGAKFLEVYRDMIYFPRLDAKAKGNDVMADMLKIALNSTFGLTKSRFSWLYDPKVLISTTVNGQLYLMMLMERIEMYSSCRIVYSNTDGITAYVPRKEEQLFKSICAQWMEYTGFSLEFNNFKRMVIKDVNNYLILTYNKKKPVKVKGCFATKTSLTSGFEYPVIAKALYAYYVDNTLPEATILNHTDIYDFMCSRRISTTKFYIHFRKTFMESTNILGGSLMKQTPTVLQKTNRWIVTKENPEEGILTRLSKKNKEDAEEHIQKGYSVTLMNNITALYEDIKAYNLNYEFYIKEAYKIIQYIKARNINQTVAKQVSLF